MKHLRLFGAIIALILFLLALVGFELHTLGTLGRVEPDNPILQQAVVQSSIFAIAKVVALLYIIYVLILKAMEVYAVKQQDDKLEGLIDKLHKSFEKEMQEEKPKVQPVEDIDLDTFKADAIFEKKLIKPLIENFEQFIDYKSVILEYYRLVGEREHSIAKDIYDNLTYPINTYPRYEEIGKLLARKFYEVPKEVIFDILLDFCGPSLQETIKG